MIRKLFTFMVLTAFLFNDPVFALAPQIVSDVPDHPARGDMYALGQKLFGIKQGPGSVPIDFDQANAGVFIGENTVPNDVKFVDPSEPSDTPGVGRIDEETDLIRAFERFRDEEALLSQTDLRIVEGYFSVDEEKGELPIARIGRNPNGSHTLIIHTKFVKMWNDIRKNDVWFDHTFPDGTTRTVKLSWAIFYRIAKHEMSDLKKTDRYKPKGGGHIGLDKLGNKISVEEDDLVANIIGGRYSYVNDAIWMWFLGSYCFSDVTRYNNDILEKRLNWFFEPVPGVDDELKLAEEFPILADASVRRSAVDLALAVNRQYFSRAGIVVPEFTVDKKFLLKAISGPDRSGAINTARKELGYTLSDMKDVSGGMIRHMDAGLSGQKSSLKMLPAFVSSPTGAEKGEYFAIDVGGSNLRVLGVELNGNGKLSDIGAPTKAHFGENHKTGTAEELFDFIAENIDLYIANNGLDRSKEMNFGLTWSFPVEQIAVDSGILKEWTKGWRTNGVVGKDVVKLLREALERKNLNNVKIAAICNDTVGTLATAGYKDKDCIAGIILGTGTNAAISLGLSDIPKFTDPTTLKDMMVNLEWGNFEEVLRNRWDEMLDGETNNKGSQLLEKLVSGMYLGEIVRLVIKDMIQKDNLFGGSQVAAFCDDPNPDEIGQKGFLSEYISRVEKDSTAELSDVGALLTELGLPNTVKRDREIVKDVCELVSTRSARVAAAAMDSIVRKVDPEMKRERIVLAIDGSLFLEHPFYKVRLMDAFRELMPDHYKKIELVPARDGSGVGAAIIAAMAVEERRKAEVSEGTVDKIDIAVEELIEEGKVLELNYTDKEGLVGFWVGKNEGYIPGGDFDISRIEKNKKISADLVLDKVLQEKLIYWIKSHKLGERYIRFRVVPGEGVLSKEDISGQVGVAHSGYRDKTVYIGLELLKYLMSDGEIKELYRQAVLDEGEFKYLSSGVYSKKISETERNKMSEIARFAEGLSVEGTSLSMFTDYVNEEGLPQINDPVKGFIKAEKGFVDVAVLELDPETVDVELSIADDIEFLPNRFNRWDGIVRDKTVARINVPRSKFAAKPIRDLERQSIVIPSDDIADNYAEMRGAVYIPHKNDHLESAGLDLTDVQPGDGYIGYVGNGNLLMNPNIVAWKNGVFFRLEGENTEGRSYPCLVKYTTGEMAIRKLSFVETKEGTRVMDTEKDEDITGKITFASSGIGIMHDKLDSLMVKYSRGNDESTSRQPGEAFKEFELWQDYDIRHYLALPFLGKAGTFGMDQFYFDDGKPNTELIEQALRGDVALMRFEDGYKKTLIDALQRMGYKEMGGKSQPSEVGKYSYLIDQEKHIIYLRFESSLYAHNICVETEDGKILFVVPQGQSTTKGVCFKEIDKMLVKLGIKARNVIVFDNGGDAMLNYRGMEVIPSFNKRDRIMSMFLFSGRHRSGKKDIKKGSVSTKTLPEKAAKAVKFFRSMHRHVADKKEKDPRKTYSRSERFVVENAQFMASQIEKAMDDIELFIKEEKKDTPRKDPAKMRSRMIEIINVLCLEPEIDGVFVEGKFNPAADRSNVEKYLLEATQSESFLKIVSENAEKLKFTEEEIKVLPEIWRLRAMMALVRFFDDTGDMVYAGMDRGGIDSSIAKLEGVTNLLQDATGDLRSDDKMARYGVIEKDIRKSLGMLRHDKDGSSSTVQELPSEKAAYIVNALREEVSKKNYRGSGLNQIVNFTAKSSMVDLGKMVDDARRFENLDKPEQGLWKREADPALYNFFTNGWMNILSSNEIIFTSEKVVAYLAKDGSIMLVVRGDDNSSPVKDISIIKVLLNGEKRAFMVLMEPSADPARKSLSRTTLAIQLTDSGILDKYPELLGALKGHLVWQDVSPESRERDIIDRSEIDLDLVAKAMGESALEIGPEEINKLLDMRYCKTMVIRKLALEALMSLYDKAHQFFISEDGLFDKEKMRTIAADFILEDISEDFRVMERALKGDRSFARDIYEKLIMPAAAKKGDADMPAFNDVSIDTVKIKFIRSIGPRQIYQANFTFDSNGKKIAGECCLELLRHDTLTSEKRSEDEIRSSVSRWIAMLQSGVDEGVAGFGASSWEIDYRSKVTLKSGIPSAWVNNIHIEAREFISGETLAQIIKRPEVLGSEKREAVKACLKTAVKLYKESKAKTGIGHFIKNPEPDDFMIRPAQGDNERAAVTVNMTKLEEYRSFRELVDAFSSPVWAEYEDIKDEVFIAYGLSEAGREGLQKARDLAVDVADGKSEVKPVGLDELELDDTVIVSEFVARIGFSHGPGSEKMDTPMITDLKVLENLYKTVDQLSENKIEVFIPQTIGMTNEVRRTLASIRKEKGEEAVVCRLFDGGNGLKAMLSTAPREGVRRIVVSEPSFQTEVKGLVESSPELFKAVRVINIALAENYGSMQANDKSICQMDVIVRALLARMLEKEGNLFVRATLKEMLDGRVNGDVDKYMDGLIESDDEATDTNSIVKRVIDNLGEIVSLVDKIGSQILILRDFVLCAA